MACSRRSFIKSVVVIGCASVVGVASGCSGNDANTPNSSGEDMTGLETTTEDHSDETVGSETSVGEISVSELLTGDDRVWFVLDELGYDSDIISIWLIRDGNLQTSYSLQGAVRGGNLPASSDIKFEDYCNLSEEDVISKLDELGCPMNTDERTFEFTLYRDDSGNEVESETVYVGDTPYRIEGLIQPTDLLDKEYVGFEAGYMGTRHLITENTFESSARIVLDDLETAEGDDRFSIS